MIVYPRWVYLWKSDGQTITTDYPIYFRLFFGGMLWCWHNTEGHALVQEGRCWHIYQGWITQSPRFHSTNFWYPCLGRHRQGGKAWDILWPQQWHQQPSPTILCLDQQGISSVRARVNCYGSHMANFCKLRVFLLVSTLDGDIKKGFSFNYDELVCE